MELYMQPRNRQKEDCMLKQILATAQICKIKTDYFELTSSQSAHVEIWLTRNDTKERICSLAYNGKTARALLATLSVYLKKKTDWIDFDDLKAEVARENEKINRGDVTEVFHSKWINEIFEREGNKVKLRYPIGKITIASNKF
jgi:hypothetical protein